MTESSAPTGYQLYEHRQDSSVLYLVRRLEDGRYEMSRYRYGSDPNEPPFTLDAESFESIYVKSRSRRSP